MTNELKNELAWALDATRNPPHVSKGLERMHVEREYARLHRLLKDIDNAQRGWEPVPVTFK